MAIVLRTTSHNFATTLKANLIDRNGDAVHYPEIQRGNQGISRDAPSYAVYVAWTTDPQYQRPVLVDFDTAFDRVMTGHWNEERLKILATRVAAIIAPGRMRYWFGITSDDDVEHAGCKDRWNTKYRFFTMNNMRILYQTDSEEYCRKAETDLIKRFPQAENRIGGGGGPLGGPPYVVYFAWKNN